MKIFASKHVYKQRLNTCRGCEHFQGLALVCKKCGCFMPAKAKIANLRCPVDKWKEVYGTEDLKWLDFREWMLNKAPSWLRWLYKKYGESFANFIKDKPFIKDKIRKLMDKVICP